MRQTMKRASFGLMMAALLAAPAFAQLQMDKLKLPEGFEISVYAEDVRNARSLALSPAGVLYVSTRGGGNGQVYAVVDEDKDFKADKVHVLAEELNQPNGVVFHKGSLYVAEISRIIRFDAIESHLESPPEPVVVYDQLPTETHHGWKYLALGPDKKLYFNVGAPCNICNMEEENPLFATIARMPLEGGAPEIVAKGVRNSVGFTWHPETGELWFTDNNRDWMGDDQPPCELNVLKEEGQHFGYPFCHGTDIPDPQFGSERDCDEFVPPAQDLGPHVAPLGMKFVTGPMFPESLQGQALIAEHGSWNRSVPIGYRLTLVELDENGKGLSYEPFIDGWLQRTKAWGRPVDVLFMEDGSLLVSDDHANVVYRVTYKP